MDALLVETRNLKSSLQGVWIELEQHPIRIDKRLRVIPAYKKNLSNAQTEIKASMQYVKEIEKLASFNVLDSKISYMLSVLDKIIPIIVRLANSTKKCKKEFESALRVIRDNNLKSPANKGFYWRFPYVEGETNKLLTEAKLLKNMLLLIKKKHAWLSR